MRRSLRIVTGNNFKLTQVLLLVLLWIISVGELMSAFTRFGLIPWIGAVFSLLILILCFVIGIQLIAPIDLSSMCDHPSPTFFIAAMLPTLIFGVVIYIAQNHFFHDFSTGHFSGGSPELK